MKALVIYDSKYGNTKMVAEEIAAAIQAQGSDADLKYVKDASPGDIAGYDIVALGTPNHMGGPTRSSKKFIKGLAGKDLGGKTFGFFDTCLKNEEGKATRKLADKLREVAPGVIIAPELSILVGGMKGPIVEGELPKCADFIGSLTTR